jgi:hypothetical protein
MVTHIRMNATAASACATTLITVAFLLPWLTSGAAVRSGYSAATALQASGLITGTLTERVIATVSWLPICAGVAAAGALVRIRLLVALAALLAVAIASAAVTVTFSAGQPVQPGSLVAVASSAAALVALAAMSRRKVRV